MIYILSLTTGCVSIVKNEILDAESYPASQSVTQQLIEEFEIETRQICDNDIGCYNYYFAPSRASKQKLSMNNNAHFTDNAYSTTLLVNRESVPKLTGSVLVIHGYRGNKDWSLITAAYFQFLGFDVYVLDLLGHGELVATKGFGVTDTEYIKRFIETEVDNSQPIIAVGNSMGGLVATSLLNQKTVDGAILQAPMISFDDALLGYVRDRKPWYHFLLSDTVLKDAANSALDEVGVSLEQTNTVGLLKNSIAPLLIFSSNIDGVAPYTAYAPIHGNNIKVVEINEVEHPYMSMIGQFEHEEIVNWLATNFVE